MLLLGDRIAHFDHSIKAKPESDFNDMPIENEIGWTSLHAGIRFWASKLRTSHHQRWQSSHHAFFLQNILKINVSPENLAIDIHTLRYFTIISIYNINFIYITFLSTGRCIGLECVPFGSFHILSVTSANLIKYQLKSIVNKAKPECVKGEASTENMFGQHVFIIRCKCSTSKPECCRPCPSNAYSIYIIVIKAAKY